MNGKRIAGGLFCIAILVTMGLLMPVVADEHDLDEVRDRKKEFVYILGEGETGILEVEIRQGEGVNYVMRSGDRPIAFNLHSESEDGEGERFFGRNSTTRQSGTFVAPADGIYVFFTERREPLEATVRLSLDGEFGIVNMTGMEPATEVPGPALVPIVVTLLAFIGILRPRRSAGES